MVLDTSSYALSLLRPDGRRWSDLRHISASLSVQPSADGSALLDMGGTRVLCIVTGPVEDDSSASASASNPSTSASTSSISTPTNPTHAPLTVTIHTARFATADRRRTGTGSGVSSDRRTAELAHAVAASLASVVHAHLFPAASRIGVALHVLAADGGVLAALVNAATLGLVDAGVPMGDYLVACAAGVLVGNGGGVGGAGGRDGGSGIPGLSVGADGGTGEIDDPLLDLSGQEELEVPYLTLGIVGNKDVIMCMMETRVEMARLEEMIAVAMDGCRHIRKILDGVVRAHGKKVMGDA